VTGEVSQGQERREQDSIWQCPLEDHFGNLIEEVFKDEKERGLMLDEGIHLLEEEDDDIDEDQPAETEKKCLQVFTNDITVKNPIAFKHLRRALSTCSG
jgi:hypothetical protein